MKNYYYYLLSIFLIVSCGKDDKPLEYSPLFSFFEKNNIIIDTVINAPSTWEYGFRFKSLKNQTITRVGIKVPVAGSFKVKLYDLNNGNLLVDTLVTSTLKFEESFININPIKIPINGEFGIAIVADVFFKVRNASGVAVDFPVTIGLIEVKSFNEEICGIPGCSEFPLITNNLVIAPCVNLTLVDTE